MIVVRFSDYEADTIDEHQSIINEVGHVWWAWWKKMHEPWPAGALLNLRRNISSSGLARIGLVDRATGRFFAASCTGVETQEGELIPTPAGDGTPAYYRNRSFPAWFRLSRVQIMAKLEWVREFGPVPTGDDTFFSATTDAQVQVLGTELPSPGRGILHISDLHFGSDHAFPSGPKIKKLKTLAEMIVDAVPYSPSCIVVSGDLTTRGEAAGLHSARIFLEGICDQLEMPRTSVVIAPGNHDILIDDPTLTRDFSNELPFRDFAKLFYEQRTDLERIHRIVDSDGLTYLIGVVNSSRPRRRETMDYGYVGADRSGPVLRTIEELRGSDAGGYWCGLVLHHHVLPAPLFEEPDDERPVSLTLDAGELVSLAQQHGIQAIMHGHQHLPFVGQVGRVAECGATSTAPKARAPLAVLGAGSAGVKTDRLAQELLSNSFGLYRPLGSSSLEVKVFKFNQGMDVETLWDFELS